LKPAYNDAHQDCRPVGEILHQIGGKWTMLIITQLGAGSMRFSELKREIGSISQKVLTATLRDLEMDGFVTRTVTPSIPPRVDYELTDLGRDLLDPVQALGRWAIENQQRILSARRQYLEIHPHAAPSRTGQIAMLRQAAE
jgi:DNA-binding HxlR family transcriptional regulator